MFLYFCYILMFIFSISRDMNLDIGLKILIILRVLVFFLCFSWGKNFKCFSFLGYRVLVEIKGTNSRDFCYSDIIIVYVLI